MLGHNFLKSMENSITIQKPVEMDLSKLDDDLDDSLFKSFHGFLIFGKLIGILPYKGIFSKSSKDLKFSWLSAHSAISYAILIILTFNSILEILQSLTAPKKNAYLIAQSFRSTLYYIWGTFIYINFILRANSFLNIFNAWRSCSVVFTKPDKKLKRDVILISVAILVSATLENATLYVGYAKALLFPNDPKSKNTTVESYYNSSHTSWAKYIPYNPFFAILAFFQHKLILFGWNYMDILIAILGRALYFKFKSLSDTAHETLVKPLREQPRFTENPKEIKLPDKKGWIQMTKDHRALNELLKAFEEFLSPLIFVSYMVNIYYICMQLLDGLTLSIDQKSTWTDAIYKPWSFLHLIARIYVVTICCARVNLYAHQIADVIYDCPSDYYNSDISRLDKRVSGGREIGLTGLGCFTVTKPFILSFIGVIFTFEIVLLQVIPTDEQTGGGQNCCCK